MRCRPDWWMNATICADAPMAQHGPGTIPRAATTAAPGRALFLRACAFRDEWPARVYGPTASADAASIGSGREGRAAWVAGPDREG